MKKKTKRTQIAIALAASVGSLMSMSRAGRALISAGGLSLVLLFMFVGSPALAGTTTPPNASTKHHPVRPDTEEIWGYAQDVINITRKHEQFRRAGTSGDFETRSYLIKKLREFGLENVGEDTLTFTRTEYKDWSFKVEGKEIPSFFLRDSAFTDINGVQAEMVYVDGVLTDDIDVAGKIVVMSIDILKVSVDGLIKAKADWEYDPNNTLRTGPGIWIIAMSENYPGSYYLAAKNGAVGFIGILPLETGTADYYPDSSMVVEPKIPALYLGKFDGAKLVKKIQRTKPVRATLTLTGTIDRNAKTANVMGILPGNTDEVILITTHFDTAWEGGAQDTSGISVVLAMARYFAEQEGDIYRQKTLAFSFGANHFGGNYPVSDDLFRDNHPEMFKNLRAAIGIEHICKRVEVINGKYVPTGEVEPHILWAPRDPLMRETMKNAVVKNGMTDSFMIEPGKMALIGEVKKFFFWGIPSFQILSGPPYLYDPVDTIDMIAKDRLAPVTGASIDLVEQLTNNFPAEWIKP